MAEVSTIEVRVKSDGARQSIDRLRNSVTQFDKSVQRSQKITSGFAQKTKQSFTGLKSTILGVVGAFGAFQIGKQLVGTIREFERLRAVLKTVEGGAEGGARAFELIRKFTATTPFELQEVTKAFLILRNTGLQVTQDRLEAFGNVAAATGKSIEQFAEAVADAAVGEFERLKEFGVLVRKEGEQLRVSFQGTTKTIANTRESVVAFLESIGKTNFAGALEEQSKTLNGVISNISDQFSFLAFQIGEGGLREALTDVARKFLDVSAVGSDTAAKLGQVLGDAVRKLGDAFFFAIEHADKLGYALGAIASIKITSTLISLGKTVVTVGTGLVTLTKNLGVVTAGVRALTLAVAANPIGLIATGLVAAAAAFVNYTKNAAAAKGVNASFFEILKATAQVLYDKLKPAIDVVVNAWNGLIDTISTVSSAIGGFFERNLSALAEPVKAAAETVKEAISGTVDEIVEQTRANQEAEAAMRAQAEATQQAATSATNLSTKTAEAGAKQAELTKSQTDFVNKLKEQNVELGVQLETVNKTATETERLTLLRKAEAQNVVQQTENLRASIVARQAELREKQFAGDFNSYIENLKRETQIMSLNRKEREIALAVLRQENAAKAAGTELTKQQRQELEETLRAHQRASEAAQERDRIEDAAKRKVIAREKEHQQAILRTGSVYRSTANVAVSSSNTIGSSISNLINKLLGRTSIGQKTGGSLGNIIGRVVSGLFGSQSTGTARVPNIGTPTVATPPIFVPPTTTASTGNVFGNQFSTLGTGGTISSSVAQRSLNVNNNITVNAETNGINDMDAIVQAIAAVATESTKNAIRGRV